jgi:SAM-dependent methyltransferase
MIQEAPPTTAAGISWTQFHRARIEFQRRWPSVWKLPVTDELFKLVLDQNERPRSVLDVGATTRVWEPTVRRHWPDAEYRSLDIDRTHTQDYYSFDDVDRTFDLVFCVEVLEHVPPNIAIELLENCARAVRPGGLVLMSVPNVLTPGAQLEFTHQTAYSHFDLPGLMSWVGLDVIDGARLCLRSRKHRLLHQYLFMPLHRAMKVDFCQCVLMLGRRRVSE